MTRWAARIHAHCLATGERLTLAEAISRFGQPQNALGEEQLESAKLEGHFKVFGGEYVAVVREPMRHSTEAHSYFHGVKRVASVWELAR